MFIIKNDQITRLHLTFVAVLLMEWLIMWQIHAPRGIMINDIDIDAASWKLRGQHTQTFTMGTLPYQ